MMEAIVAKSYKRLIKAGRKAVGDVPAEVVPYLKEIAPELFGENGVGDFPNPAGHGASDQREGEI